MRILYFLCFLTVVSMPQSSIAAKNDVGNFDIAKVRNAISDIPTNSSDTIKTTSLNNIVKKESLGKIVFRIIVYLSIIIIVMIGLFWGIRTMGLVGSSRIGGGSMDVLEGLAIGQGRTISLVRVMDSVLVIAQSQQNITLIDKIEGDKAVELIASTKGGTSIVHFRDAFNNFMGLSNKKD